MPDNSEFIILQYNNNYYCGNLEMKNSSSSKLNIHIIIIIIINKCMVHDFLSMCCITEVSDICRRGSPKVTLEVPNEAGWMTVHKPTDTQMSVLLSCHSIREGRHPEHLPLLRP